VLARARTLYSRCVTIWVLKARRRVRGATSDRSSEPACRRPGDIRPRGSCTAQPPNQLGVRRTSGYRRERPTAVMLTAPTMDPSS
jgi:hypothetical protein